MTLQLCAAPCAHHSRPLERHFAAEDESEIDPTPLEAWILDDFEWDVETAYPERGDYWDDSLDRESDCAARPQFLPERPTSQHRFALSQPRPEGRG